MTFVTRTRRRKKRKGLLKTYLLDETTMHALIRVQERTGAISATEAVRQSIRQMDTFQHALSSGYTRIIAENDDKRMLLLQKQ